MAPNHYSLGVVILAAGRSQRMGRPKLLLPWKGTTVLGHLVARWQELGPAQLTVVSAKADTGLAMELDRLGFPSSDRIENPAPETGMFGSVRCAARWAGWKPALTHWALVLGDQPQIRPETLRAVLALSEQHPDKVCQPTFQSHRRHPVILPRPVFLGASLSASQTLKDFLRQQAAVYCPLNDDGLGLDLDSPEDYATALRLFS